MSRSDVCGHSTGQIATMDQIEPLFPIPLMRSPGLRSPALIESATAAIRNARVDRNQRSDQLFHTEISNPRDNKLFQTTAELAVPKLVELGYVLIGDSPRWNVT